MAESRVVRRNFSNLSEAQATNQAKQIMEEINSDKKDSIDSTKLFTEHNNDYKTSVDGFSKNINLITETCELPSKGLLYNGALGSSVELRAMTTIEERMRVSGENFWSTMASILNRCMVNTDFDARNLIDFDFFALLVKLRTITYGNIYKTSSRCLTCNKYQDVDVDLDHVVITEIPDDFAEPIKLGPLPKCGDTLGIRFLRVFDHIDITNQTNAYKNKLSRQPNGEDLGNPEYTLEMEKMLVTVNDAELDQIARSSYISNMIGMDSSYFHKFVEKLFFGVHRIGTSVCEDENCKSLLLYQISPDTEFFRATFDD